MLPLGESRIPHDFRRTAVRNLKRAGAPRSAAMAMVGHKTQAIYQRYAIVGEIMMREAGDKLAALHREEGPRRSFAPVTPIGKPRSEKKRDNSGTISPSGNPTALTVAR